MKDPALDVTDALTTVSAAPRHLSSGAKRLWTELVREYGIADAAGLAILTSGLEAFDRAKGAREQIKREGTTSRDRFGQLKPHPLLPVERDARSQFLLAMKQLQFDVEPLRDGPGRPGGK